MWLAMLNHLAVADFILCGARRMRDDAHAMINEEGGNKLQHDGGIARENMERGLAAQIPILVVNHQ